MTANGLIVAFVVALWAAYFVPLVLRRYDEASKTHSLESLSSLSRVITRRTRAVDEPESQVAAPSPAPVPTDAPAPVRASARLAARRRRRTLLTLLAGLLLVAGLVGFKIIAPVWLGVPVALVAAWLVACRVQVRGELGLSAPRSTRTATTTSKQAGVARTTDPANEDTIIVSGQFEEVDPGRAHVMEQVPLEADALDEQIVIAVPSVATTGEALWDPLPVTVPTYVTKPRVGRTVRTIDFAAAGTWTSGHVEGEDVEMPGQKHSDTQQGSDDQRRASGQ
ncbi:MAG: hypothetical protein EON52_14960 [Actinomycetales bacterium]|nr:MAG: hypothetical protein EON52_14960 [Actinomycetales bacterium]